MPKTSTYALVWLAEQGRYVLQEKGQPQALSVEGEWWLAWLAEHSSFAFWGQQGHVTLLKESRTRGAEGYWYAYRSQGGRTLKKYVGRNDNLTPMSLEETARFFSHARDAGQHSLSKTQKREKAEHQSEQAITDQPGPIQPAPLLAPKLRGPRLRGSLVARTRLLARLDAGLERKLTLISAPAGFGKTTLVSQWMAHLAARPHAPLLAWVSLDAGDNDPVRFWRYVITACQPLLPDAGQAALAHLQASQTAFKPSELETALTLFLNELSQIGQAGLLVLEEYHLITAPRISETLQFWLDHLPATMHLVIVSRSEPALPLAKLRARGELSEIHTVDLRFSQQEVKDFLQQALTLPLSEQAVAHLQTRLETRLEGWAAGLRLVVLALQGNAAPDEVERFLAGFAGSHRSILEYFVSEVLDAQTEPIQSFLLHTSLLSRLTAPLCDAVTSRDDSARMLETLERANLFLEPLDSLGQWYRYHALFAEAMQHEAQRRLGQSKLHALASHASRWYEQQSQLAEAIDTAFQAQQFERCASLLEQVCATSHREYSNEFYTLHRWLEQLPEATFRQRPTLCLEYVTVLIFAASSHPLSDETQLRMESLLGMAEAYAKAHNNLATLGNVVSLRAMRAWYLGQIAPALDYARQALEWLPKDNLEGRSASISTIGRAEVLAGNFEMARRRFLEARALSTACGNHTYVRAMDGMLSGVYIEQGELHIAETGFLRVLTEAREKGDLDDVAHSQTGLAQLEYEWNNLEAARQRAQEALEISAQLLNSAHQTNATLILARVAYAHGDEVSAQHFLLACIQGAQPHHFFQIYRETRTWQARFQLAAGDLAAVQRWIDTRPPRDAMLPVVQYAREQLLISRLWLAQDEAHKALDLLNHLLSEAQEAQHTHVMLEIQVLMVLTYNACKQRPEALQTLQEVLSTARPAGYLRLFLDEGAQLAVLLRTVLAHTREKALRTYVQRILNAFAHEAGQQNEVLCADTALLSEPLSPQEHRVLRLLVAGRSNPEIARELIVSVNTVRTQVQSIYRKLNVNNRVAASEIARELKLI